MTAPTDTGRNRTSGHRLDFRFGAHGVRGAVSDALTAVGTEPDGSAWVVLMVDPETGQIDQRNVGLREARRLLEATIVKLGDEYRALQVDTIGRLNARDVWELVAYCEDGAARVFTAKEWRPGKRVPFRPETRFAILERDSFTCRYCGRSAATVELHVDHIKPVAKGGSDDPANLVTACRDCNLGKSDRVSTPMSVEGDVG